MKKKNEDAMLLEQVRIGKERILFAVVCDGIGGMQDGEYASGLVVTEMKRWFFDEGLEIFRGNISKRKQIKAYITSLEDRLRRISEKMIRYGTKKRCCIGTTCCAALLLGNRYLMFSIGDSCLMKLSTRRRKYLNRPDINEKGQLLRCIGSEGWYPVCYSSGFLRGKDMLLLGTDGFFRFLSLTDIDDLFLQLGKNVCWSKEGNILRNKKMKSWMDSMEKQLRSRGEWDDMTAILIGR